MDLGSNLKNTASRMANDLIGNNRHAMILVWDYRQKAAETQQAGGPAGGMAVMTKQVLSKGWKANLPADAMDTMKSYSVQFNPSSLRVTAHNDPVSHGNVGGGKLPSSDATTQAPNLELHVNLIFDRVNIGDAFIGDKFSTFASTQAVSNLATAITKKAMGDNTPFSVKREVEAFIATLRNPATRSLSFVWNKFEFNGVLKNVNAEYTMFSPSGRPVRAKVGLRLRQQLTNANQAYWVNEFEKVFQGAGGALSLTKLF